MEFVLCGDLSEPFIKTDRQILERIGTVNVLNTPIKFSEFPAFVTGLLRSIPDIICSDISYIWFADIPAFPVVLLCKLFGKKSVVCVGDHEVLGVKEINLGLQLSPLRGWIARWILRNADVCITPSEPYYTIIKDLTPTANVKVVPCAIDTDLCDVELPVKEKVAITSHCSVNEGRVKRKGLHVFREIQSSKFPYPLKELVRVPRKQYIEELKKAKVYCQLSYTEAFGVSVAEAMALGCVPVITNRGSLPWVVGGTGVVVPYGDTTATEYGIERAMQMDGGKCRERVKEFSIQNRERKIRDILQSIF